MIVKIKEREFGLRLNMKAFSEIKKAIGKGLTAWFKECHETQEIDADDFCSIVSIASKWAGSSIDKNWLMENIDASDIPNIMKALALTLNKDAEVEDLEDNPL